MSFRGNREARISVRRPGLGDHTNYIVCLCQYMCVRVCVCVCVCGGRRCGGGILTILKVIIVISLTRRCQYMKSLLFSRDKCVFDRTRLSDMMR